MDPLTAGLQLATAIVELLTKVWDATPETEKAQGAGDIARTLHNCSALIQDAQKKINAGLGVK